LLGRVLRHSQFQAGKRTFVSSLRPLEQSTLAIASSY